MAMGVNRSQAHGMLGETWDGLDFKQIIPGRQPPGFEWSREAASALSRGREPMDSNASHAEPRRRRQQMALGVS